MNASSSTTIAKQQKMPLRPQDVICGKASRQTRKHKGNRYYRSMLRRYAASYHAARYLSAERRLIKEAILGAIKSKGGRFVTKCKDQWEEMSDEPVKKKIGHNLRSKSAREPRLGHDLVSSDSSCASWDDDEVLTFAIPEQPTPVVTPTSMRDLLGSEITVVNDETTDTAAAVLVSCNTDAEVMKSLRLATATSCRK